jgi:hypothetical protein
MVQVGVILVECDDNDADKDKRVVEILRTKGRSGLAHESSERN